MNTFLIILGLGLFSVLFFIGSLLAVPFFVKRLPQDYLIPKEKKPPVPLTWYRILLTIAKNLLGIAVLIIGIVMLFTPGQGLLTIFMGLVLVDFPNKQYWIIKYMSRPAALNTINWMREKRGKPPLILES